MFYFVALTFFPAFILLTVPLGLGLMAVMFRGTPIVGQSEAGIRSALAPLIGLAALVIILGPALRLGLPSSALVYLAAGSAGAGLLALGWIGSRSTFVLKDLAVVVLVAFFGYLALISPLLIDGRFTVLGYNTNNDPVFHATIPEYIDTYGYQFPEEFESGFEQAAIDKLEQQGYPEAWHHFLLLAQKIYGLRAYHLFNMAVAFFGSFVAFAVYAWARAGGLGRGWAAAAAAAGTIGYLQMSYAFQGFAPQVAVTPLLYGALISLYQALIKGERRFFIAAALFVQAGVAVYSFTILLWLGAYLAAAGVWLLVRRGVGVALRDTAVAVLAVVVGLVANPFVLTRLYVSFRAVLDFAGSDSLGNLVSAQVPILPLLNIWPAGDHRLLPVGSLNRLSYLPAVLVLALLLAGLLSKNRRSLWLIGAAAVFAPMVVVKVVAGPYYFAKTLQMAAPLTGAGVVAGIYLLTRERYRVAIVAITGLLAVGAIVSNVGLVQAISRTPADRFDELLEINERFGTDERALFFARGEDWGPYLLSGWRTAAPLARTYQGRPPGVRGAKQVADGVATANDLDDLYSVLSTRFDWLIIDKAADISLPPPPFELAQGGNFYNVYRRTGPVSRAIKHIPAEDAADPQSLPYLEVPPGESVRLETGTPFSSLLVSAYFFPHLVIEPAAWRTDSTDWRYGEANGFPAFNLADKAGSAVSFFEVIETGSYDVWLSGDFSGDLTISLNGRNLERAGESFRLVAGSGPAWQRLAETALDAGEGRLDLAAAGPGAGSYIGKVVLADLDPQFADQAVFVATDRSATVRLGRLPAVHAVPLRSGSSGVVRVKNLSTHPLRLDWIEPLAGADDPEALFGYNRNNKLVFQAIYRMVSR